LRRLGSEIWKTLLVPGGVVLLGAAMLHAGGTTLPPQAITFLYYCALSGGLLLAWRFHCSRVGFALLVLFATEEAASLVRAPHLGPGAAGWTVARAITILLPLNFILIALTEERGFTASSAAPISLFLFLEFVFVGVLYRAAASQPLTLVRGHHLPMVSWPSYVWLLLLATGVFLLARSLLIRKPADSALFWSLCAAILSFRFLDSARISTLYSAAAAAILAASVIENSYLLAYHDELTRLPSRRAWNDALVRLQHPYAIAVVDIDHFKRFNDTYGHDTGDEVLRLVATNLSRVTGGGRAFRCGGEEFAILFLRKNGSEVFDHLEQLRKQVEKSKFRLRGGERRRVARGPERRNKATGQRNRSGVVTGRQGRESTTELSVTVSIGLGWSSGQEAVPNAVLEAADQALYRAKANGRNRVETMTVARRRLRVRSRGIA
jgi:diguanylate cyclase (GGDEF)-like protein